MGGKVKSGLGKLKPRGRKQMHILDPVEGGDQRLAGALA